MIEAYKQLWTDREAADNIRTEEDLKALIAKELNDEMTHPRVRKTRAEKLELAFNRINSSRLAEVEKAGLSDLYRRVADQLETN